MAPPSHVDTPMANGASFDGTNGVNGTEHLPQTPRRTPSVGGLSLTEYSAVSPPSEPGSIKAKKLVPDEFLLPNGYPDVRILPSA